MIGWTNINPVLLATFTEIGQSLAITNTRDFAAEWKEGPRSATHPEQRFSLLLKVTSVVGIGTDETIYENVPEDSTDPDDASYLGQMRATQVGQRKFTLQVQIESPEHTDAFWAMAHTERIRTALRRPRIIDALNDVDVAIIEIRQAVKASFKDGSRKVSAASMDITFGTVANDVDPIPTGWIEAITITSHLQDTDGIELPVSLQMVDEVIPEGFVVPPPGLLQENTTTGNVQINTGTGNVQVSP